MSVSVRYYAHHLELSGYGRAAAGYIEALGRAGAEVGVHPMDAAGTSWGEKVDVEIYHSTPSRLANVERSSADHYVAITTWETDPLPPEHVVTLNAFDDVIVPSAFCKDLLRSVEKPIHVVPHGFDPEFWAICPPLDVRPSICTFYSIGAWGERKNTLGLLKAYLHAFRKKDRTRLVLIVDKVNLQAVHSVLARSLIPRDELPGLVIPDHRPSDEEILALHREGDCFVTATRSEGYGLPIFEAAIMGKPIIAPGWGGHAEFLRGLPQWRKVWHAMTPVFPGEDDVSVENGAMRVQVTLPAGANSSQLWAEPSLDRLALDMRMIHTDFREGLLKDRHDQRPWFERHYGFDAIGAKFLNTLKEILK